MYIGLGLEFIWKGFSSRMVMVWSISKVRMKEVERRREREGGGFWIVIFLKDSVLCNRELSFIGVYYIWLIVLRV